jgi:mono/diheme cytochrome c family protein
MLHVAIAAAGLCLACGSSEAPGAQSSPPPAAASTAPEPAAAPAAPSSGSAVAEAEQIFSMRCVTCHGAQGAGDGPGSAALNPKPRDFRDAAWQASVDDEHLKKIIQFGGAAVGKSPAMPGNPDLMSKPEVVAALVAHVRGLKQ